MNIKPNVDLFEVKSGITANQSFLRAFHWIEENKDA